MVSDVQEWLASLSVQARLGLGPSSASTSHLIHCCPAVHAKAVISDSLAMMGATSLTSHGILARTEIGILL